MRLTRHDIRFPNEVIIEDANDEVSGSGTNTPAGEPSDDFFSSWDKPAIKRPSNPPSRTGTPSNNPARTTSPFLNANTANGNAAARSKSPLGGEDAPTAPKTISSTAIRKSALTSKPKTSILGAKKTKLGAKKVDAGALDFDEAEKKAREEAERKARLGYDPDEESGGTPSEQAIEQKQPATTAQIHAPSPVSPPRGGGAGGRDGADVEKLGMGVRRRGMIWRI
jgi:ADP-ribosylation factor GTPase-activating protein 2/3